MGLLLASLEVNLLVLDAMKTCAGVHENGGNVPTLALSHYAEVRLVRIWDNVGLLGLVTVLGLLAVHVVEEVSEPGARLCGRARLSGRRHRRFVGMRVGTAL